jgi:hypothetical protein
MISSNKEKKDTISNKKKIWLVAKDMINNNKKNK